MKLTLHNKIEFLHCDVNFHLHLLSHFTVIDEDYRKELLKTELINNKEIEKKLGMVGSKFHPTLSKNDRILKQEY
jgi:predicted transcriptional regulator